LEILIKMSDFNQVLESLEFLKDDSMAIKRVKETATQIISFLKEECNETSIDKALRELEGLDSSEVPAYDRTLLWDVISVLERFSISTKP